MIKEKEVSKIWDEVYVGRVSDERRKEIMKILKQYLEEQQKREAELEKLEKEVYDNNIRSHSIQEYINSLTHKYKAKDIIIYTDKDGMLIGRIASLEKHRNYKVTVGNWQDGEGTTLVKMHERQIRGMAWKYKIVFPDTPGVFV